MVSRFRSQLFSTLDRYTHRVIHKTRFILRHGFWYFKGMAEATLYPAYAIARLGRYVFKQLQTDPNKPLASSSCDHSIQATMQFVRSSPLLKSFEDLCGLASDCSSGQIQVVFADFTIQTPSNLDQVLINQWIAWELNRRTLAHDLQHYRSSLTDFYPIWETRLLATATSIHSHYEAFERQLIEKLQQLTPFQPVLSWVRSVKARIQTHQLAHRSPWRRCIPTQSALYPFTFSSPPSQCSDWDPNPVRVSQVSRSVCPLYPVGLPEPVEKKHQISNSPPAAELDSPPTLDSSEDIDPLLAQTRSNPLPQEFQTRYPSFAPNWIDVDATVIGYVQSPLMWVMSRVDLIVYNLEQLALRLLHWVRSLWQ